MSKRIILIRHGTVIPGKAPDENPALSKLGEEQCQRLGTMLPIKEIELVITSPLQRAIDSAERIFGSSRSLFVMHHLAEVGQNVSPTFEVSSDNIATLVAFEAIPDLEERCRLIRRWLREREEQIIAVVSHAGLLHHLTRTDQTTLHLPLYKALDIATWLFKHKCMRRLIETIYHWGALGWHHAEYRVYTINDDDNASLYKIKTPEYSHELERQSRI